MMRRYKKCLEYETKIHQIFYFDIMTLATFKAIKIIWNFAKKIDQ